MKFNVLGIFDTEQDEREHRTITNVPYTHENIDLYQISKNGSQDISCPRVGNICENFTFYIFFLQSASQCLHSLISFDIGDIVQKTEDGKYEKRG